MARSGGFRAVALIVFLVGPWPGRVHADGPAPEDALAGELARLAPCAGGLCVQVGCDDGGLSVALARAGRFLVHAWEPDAGRVERARRTIAAAGLYGQASVEAGGLSRLPYADNLVDLLIVQDLPRALKEGLAMSEVLRVVRPLGVAVLGRRDGGGQGGLTEESLRSCMAAAGVRDFQVLRSSGLWARLVKPWPAEMDPWTHRRHDPGGSRVSQDRLVGPLADLRWEAGPIFPTGRDGARFSGLVSAGGRSFYVLQREHVRLLPPGRDAPDAEFFLLARDAFNGLPQWMVPLPRRQARWSVYRGGNAANWLVVADERVFVVTDDQVVALDAATGGLVRAYCRFPGGYSGKLLVRDGRLVVVSDSQTAAFDAASGREQWRAPSANCREAVLTDDRLVLYAARKGEPQKTLTALDLKTGQERWRTDTAAWDAGDIQDMFYKDGVLVASTSGGQGQAAVVHGISPKDGSILWRHPYTLPARASARVSVLPAGGSIWVLKVLADRGRSSAHWDGLDPASGAVERSLAPTAMPGIGCNEDTATERFFMSKRPADAMSWEDGKLSSFRAARSGCQVGAVLANGLYYTFPDVCMCVKGEVRGYTAFAPASPTPPRPAPADAPERLQQGPAAAAAAPAGAADAQDWPMFRHDARRTGGTAMSLPADLQPLWDVQVDDQAAADRMLSGEWAGGPLGEDRLTPPVVAGGTVFVGLPDAHRVIALDADTGKITWSFTTGGRLDCPPAIHEGICLLACRDGWVYGLDGRGGGLLWRFRAAPAEQRVLAFGQLESSWPAAGDVLVAKGTACVIAGRSTEVGGGLHLYGLDPRSGRLRWAEHLGSQTGRSMGFDADLLVAAGEGFCIGSGVSLYEPTTGKSLGRKTAESLRQVTGQLGSGASTFSVGLILDRSWHRADSFSRFHTQYYAGLTGQLVVFNDRLAVAGRRNTRQDGAVGPAAGRGQAGELVAKANDKPAGDPPLWTLPLPATFQVEAMALSGETLFASGPLEGSAEVRGQLWAVSLADGSKRNSRPLAHRPASDGIALARGRLYLATRDGRLICFGNK